MRCHILEADINFDRRANTEGPVRTRHLKSVILSTNNFWPCKKKLAQKMREKALNKAKLLKSA